MQEFHVLSFGEPRYHFTFGLLCQVGTWSRAMKRHHWVQTVLGVAVRLYNCYILKNIAHQWKKNGRELLRHLEAGVRCVDVLSNRRRQVSVELLRVDLATGSLEAACAICSLQGFVETWRVPAATAVAIA